MKISSAVRAVLVAGAAVLAAACAHQSVRDSASGKSAGPAPALGPAAPIETAAAVEPSVRDAAFQSIPELKTVTFAYDSDNLSADARATLKANARWLKEHATVKVQVAGNCDQRGTVEYNLALGQRRANAVRSYYRHLGVSGRRVATISYGKEHPVCSDATEDCWGRNRRSETLEALLQNVSKK